VRLDPHTTFEEHYDHLMISEQFTRFDRLLDTMNTITVPQAGSEAIRGLLYSIEHLRKHIGQEEKASNT
jgi:hypothetical protein